MRRPRWTVPLAAAAAGLVVVVVVAAATAAEAGVARGDAVRGPLSPTLLRQDGNPGPCVAVVEVQCFCVEPRLFIDGVAVPFPAPLSEQLYTNVTTMIMPNSTVVFTGLVGSNDSAALGWALRVNVTGQRESAFGTPSIDSVFWQAAIVTDAFAANVTAAIRPAPPSPPAEGATPPPPEPTTGLRYPWTTAEPLDDDAAGNFTAWILPPSTFLREVRPPDVALPYWIAARAPALPGELCAGGFLPGDPTPLPSAPTPSAGGSPRTGGAAAPPRRGPISDRATMGVVHGLWALLGVVGVVTIVATWANTARLGRLQLEETTFVPPGDGRGGGGRGGGSGGGGGGGDRRRPWATGAGGGADPLLADDLLQDGVNRPVALALATRATLAREAATPWAAGER